MLSSDMLPHLLIHTNVMAFAVVYAMQTKFQRIKKTTHLWAELDLVTCGLCAMASVRSTLERQTKNQKYTNQMRVALHSLHTHHEQP